jgi:hypothetical protein
MSDQPTIAQETAAEVKRKPLGDVKIHTMPDKFLNYLTKGRVLTAGGTVTVETKLGGLKRNVIIGLAMALVFVLVLGAAAWFFVKSINQKPEDNLIINQPSGQNQAANKLAPEQKSGVSECSDTNCEACSADQCRILANINKCQLQSVSEQDLASGEMKVVEKCVATVAALNSEATTTPPVEEKNPPAKEEGVIVAADTDQDGLTDEEERIWGTDKDVVDTDGDGYTDSLEIANSYNPLRGDSARLATSNLVNSFVDKDNGFSVLYPRAFTTTVNDDKSGVSFTATSPGQFFQVQVLANENNTTDIEQWYLEMNPTAKPEEIQQTQIGGQPSVAAGSSSFYVLSGGKIYLINYNMGYPATAYFSASFNAFVKSFDFFENPLPAVNE